MRTRSPRPVHRQRQRQERQREGDHVSVQVAVEEGEGRELSDRLHLSRCGGDDAGRVPVPGFGAQWKRSAVGDHLPQSLEHGDCLGKAGDGAGKGLAAQRDERCTDEPHHTQVAQHDGENKRHHPCQQAPAPVPTEEVAGDGEGPHAGQCVQERHCQVVGNRRHRAHQLDERADDDEAEVVVVNVGAGEPGVIGREPGGLHHRVEVGEVHRLLATDDRVPQVRLQEPHADPGEVEQCEEPLGQQEQPPVAVQEAAQFSPPEPSHPTSDQR